VTASDRRPPEGCPVTGTDYREDRPAFWHYEQLNAVREEHPVLWNTNNGGFWMFTRYEQVREALQNAAVFTNDTISPFEPEPGLLLLPQMLNPPEHVRYRHILNPWFSAGTLERLDPLARSCCTRIIDGLVDRGRCDLVADFGIAFPTEVFLASIGLPVEDGELFVPWVEAIFAGFFGGDADAQTAAVRGALDYFEAVIVDRERQPGDPTTDFVTYLLASRADDEPLPRDHVRTICLTLMLAGLDTTRSALGYIFHHLATHDDDRRRLIDEPALVPSAVEEFLRLYTLILTSGRRVSRDVEFHGCPLKAGDVVWLGVSSANRDPRRFDRPDEFVPDRSPNPHLAFAAGAHRCLGAHLARKELVMALEEWHRRIPDYHLAGPEPLEERGGQLTLRHLPLAWAPPERS
jgi:cytochrome P450